MRYYNEFSEDDEDIREEMEAEFEEEFGWDEDDIDDTEFVEEYSGGDDDMPVFPEDKDRHIFNLWIEHDNSCIELTVKVTPKALDGKRYIDILEAFDLHTSQSVESPRSIISPTVIEAALDLLIWSVVYDDELTDDEREDYLSDLR